MAPRLFLAWQKNRKLYMAEDLHPPRENRSCGNARPRLRFSRRMIFRKAWVNGRREKWRRAGAGAPVLAPLIFCINFRNPIDKCYNYVVIYIHQFRKNIQGDQIYTGRPQEIQRCIFHHSWCLPRITWGNSRRNTPGQLWIYNLDRIHWKTYS